MVWSGGAGQLSHLLDACQNGSKALLLASMIHENEFSVGQIKTFLKSHQIPIR
jgi:cyclase